MRLDDLHTLSAYEDVTPLCEKGHVVLVQNRQDGQLYVKKHLCSYHPELYLQLRERPVSNTPAIYGVYEDKSGTDASATRLVIIEEYLSGSTLAELLEERGLFSEKEVIDIGLQLCRILKELHGRTPPIIHRDIKPSNVMLLSDGTVKLLDFNASKPEIADEGRDTVLMGTAGFAAPEQYGFSSSTPQTDLYAVGVLLNVLLTGAFPWEKAADGNLKQVIRRCLEMNPKDRYAGAWELYQVLRRTRREKFPWLPPGFRSMRLYKMLIAIPVYLFIIIFSLRIDTSDQETLAEKNLMHMTFLLLGILPVLFYCNYMDIQRWFPFMRSPDRRLRILGLILSPIFLAVFLMALLVLLFLIFAYPW